MQIASIIRRAAVQFKDAPCLTEGDRTLSFRDFDAATDRLGNALISKGLLPGDRVRVKRPKQILVWPELPKSGTGKVLRRSVRDSLTAGAV